MRELGKLYTHTSYQGYFVVDNENSSYTIKNTFIYVCRAIHTWIRRKFSQMFIPDQPCVFQKDLHGRSVSILFSYDDMLYCMITKHPDEIIPNRVWTTEAEVSCRDGKISLAVVNHYTSPETDKDYNLCSPPGFVTSLSYRLRLTDVGKPVNAISTIESDVDLLELQCLIEDPDRQFPVVVISENIARDEMEAMYETDNGYHVDGEKLANDVRNIAHVFYLPVCFQEKWCSEIGDDYGVYAGAIRTYYCGFNPETQSSISHPFLTSQKILRMSYTDSEGRELLAGHAFRHILTHKLKLDCMYHRINWKKLGVKFYYQHILEKRNEKNDLDHLSEQIMDAYKKQVEDLELQQNQLEIEKEVLNEQIDRQKAIIWKNQERIQRLEEKLKDLGQISQEEFPNNYSEIPEWIDNNYAGRIFLHNRAKRALKAAVYKDVNLVCKAINILGTTYYQMRNSNASIEAYKKELEELNIQEGITISETSAGMQGDEYYVEYNGKRQKLDRHLKSGTSHDQRETFRLYYFWDDDERQVVIGYLPDHLRTRTT